MANKQLELWQGPFGDLYQERNKFTDDEVSIRLAFWDNVWKSIYLKCGAIPKSVLEIGAGQGQNLAALNKLSMGIEQQIELFATECNDKARTILKENVPNVTLLATPIEKVADLVVTYGVLIHTHPAHLKQQMRDIYNASKRWIIAVEYFAPETTNKLYHGEKDALWLDDYGSHFIDNFSLRIIGYGFCWKKTTQLDNVTFWIMEKTEKMN
jgi:spore coat polysaccharide biosynthesis protein SpsF